MFKPYLQLVAMFVVIAGAVFLPTAARAQTSGPEDIVRGFYSWYLHELSLENGVPMKKKTTMLKYVTPQLYANEPRLVRRMGADIFICAQDWDTGWEQNFRINTPQVKNNTATTTVALPSGTDQIKINVTLIKFAAGWRINKVACAE
ncbi:MAG TPA: DUF3828 domain-containing protein [Pyrinomonadaceae bacterium]